MKVCRRCRSTNNGFTKLSAAPDGLDSLCKKCASEDRARRYAKRVNRPVQRQPRQSGYIKHGYSKFPEYRLWAGIKDRCLNPRSRAYSSYGGRGIKVCDAWVNSFVRFLEDIGRRPSRGHTVERIDNDGNYEPANVKWATMKEQSRNRRSVRWITIDGETLCATDWARKNRVPRGTVLGKLSQGYSDEDSVKALPLERSCTRCGSFFKPRCTSQLYCGAACRVRAGNARFILTRQRYKGELS